VILFGGAVGSQGPANDTWQWDGKHWAQRGDFGPQPREITAMAYDGARGRVVLFGGYVSPSSFFTDTWELAEYPPS
jgi:hypothetical protein